MYLYKQIENGERQIYEYRLNILKYEFEKERESLKHLFVDQHFNEFNNQINILKLQEEEDSLKQFIRYRSDKQHLQEKFIKDITLLQANFKIKVSLLSSTMTKVS